MAAMVGGVSNVRRVQGLRTFQVYFDLALTGDYVTGGVNVFGASRVDGDSQLRVPTTKRVQNVTVKGRAGYVYEFDYENEKLLIRQEGAAGSPAPELAAAALPAGVLADKIAVEMTYPKFG